MDLKVLILLILHIAAVYPVSLEYAREHFDEILISCTQELGIDLIVQKPIQDRQGDIACLGECIYRNIEFIHDNGTLNYENIKKELRPMEAESIIKTCADTGGNDSCSLGACINKVTMNPITTSSV